MATSLGGLAKRLVRDDLINEDEALTATQNSEKEKKSLVAYLVEADLVSAQQLANVASEEFGTPIFDLSAFDLEALPRDLIANNLLQAHHVIPLIKRGNRLFIGVSDPTNLIAIDEIKFHTGLSVEAVLVEEDKLNQALEALLDDSSDAFGDLGDDDGLDDLDVVDTKKEDDANVADGADDAPVVRFINQMLLSAIKKGASDRSR